MVYASHELCRLGVFLAVFNPTSGCDMTCHYGKDGDALETWLIAECGGTLCTFDNGLGCEAEACNDGRVRTLLAATPISCSDRFVAAWQTLRQTCGRQDGACCTTCDGPIMSSCTKLPRLSQKYVTTMYTATASVALTAYWLTPTKVCALTDTLPSNYQSDYGL